MSPGGGGGRFGIPVDAVEVWMGWGSWVTWGIDAWVWTLAAHRDLVHHSGWDSEMLQGGGLTKIPIFWFWVMITNIRSSND